MTGALKLGTTHYVGLEEAAMEYLSAELDEFVQISTSLVKSFGFLQSRVKSKFPKDCRKCGKSYKSFEEFYYGTDEIVQGTVSYPTLGSEFYLHRNCKSPCESTLVVIFNDRRDDTALGCRRREVFQDCLDKIAARTPIPCAAARTFLLGLLARRIQEHLAKASC
ncbi:MAG: hypothetical protein H7249_15275 [Chitinophagaceae bacterium]|nr:hypothetical protein [Oligoflexus sp.]